MYARRSTSPAVALDFASTRSFDVDGRLHVSTANISKANVCPYRGEEIPEWQSLGLRPDRVYKLLRDPDELEQAAETFRSVPLLSDHVPVSADDHQPDIVVGAIGSDVEFAFPYLRASLVVWSAAAIAGIESGRQRELSAAYRYRCIMGSGNFHGEPFDGRMVDLVGNHVALVATGRVGSDVVVGDSRHRSNVDQFMIDLKKSAGSIPRRIRQL
jgi:hypothetical protein